MANAITIAEITIAEIVITATHISAIGIASALGNGQDGVVGVEDEGPGNGGLGVGGTERDKRRGDRRHNHVDLSVARDIYRSALELVVTELRDPAVVIAGYADILVEGDADPETKALAARIAEQAERMTRILRSVHWAVPRNDGSIDASKPLGSSSLDYLVDRPVITHDE